MGKPILLVTATKDDVAGFIKDLPSNLVTAVKQIKPLPIKFEDAIKKQVKEVVTISLKKEAKKKKGPVIKKKAKKKKKVVGTTPLRPSPLKIGDKVWVEIGDKWLLAEITLTRPPTRVKKEIVWMYKVSITDDLFTEDELIPDKIFTLNANDAVYMKEAEFAAALNKTFDEKVVILAVFRKGQKRPWAYYVIPNRDIYLKEQKHVFKPYGNGYEQEYTDIVYIKPAEQMTLKLIPVSGAPQEILTYLGLHVYNRKWVRLHGVHADETKALE
jgi:hypothetical protein